MDLMKLQNGSDVRGVAIEGVEGENVNLTPQIAKQIGCAYVSWLAKKLDVDATALRLGVGRDSRVTGPALAEALIEGMISAGATVVDCGMATTPAMFMSIVFPETNFNGSAMITASHLPFNRNGIKFFDIDGGLEHEDITEILNLAGFLNPAKVNAPVEKLDLLSIYADYLRGKIADGLKELVTGYKGKKGTFVITGIYVNDGSDEYVTNTNVLTKDSDKILFTKDHQVIRKSGSFDHVLTLDHENHYQVRRSLKDLLAFFQKKKSKTVSLQAKCAMSFYEKETGIPLPAYQKSQSRTMTKWLKAFRTGHVLSCDQIAKTMPKYTEELSSLKMSSGMRNAYLEVVKEYRGKRFVIGGGNLGAYYLSDLDGDGKVELIIEDFDCDCPSVLNIYKYQNKKAKEVVSGYEYATYVNKNGPPFGSPSEDELSFYAYENHPGMICYERHDGKEQVSILKLSGHKLKKIKYSSHPCRKVKGKAHFTNLGMQLDGHRCGEDSFDYSLLGFIPQPVPEGTIVEDWY